MKVPGGLIQDITRKMLGNLDDRFTVFRGSLSDSFGLSQLTGDVTAGPGTGSQAATLANSGASAGTYGSATKAPVFTVDAKGRITAVSEATISGVSGNSLYEITQITHAQIQTLNSSPVTILTAGGAGIFKRPLSVTYNYDFSAGAYNDITVRTRYAGDTNDVCITFSNVFNQTAKRTTILSPSAGTYANTITVNVALTLTAASNPTGGNAANTMQAIVEYLPFTVR